jgi:GNAT superfamily N-acetyltransferase
MPIRRAALPDVPQLLSLVRRYWEFEGLTPFNALRTEVVLEGLISQASRGAVWVADEDGRLVGYLILVFVVSVEHGGLMAEIDELYVCEADRGRGTGGGLLSACEEEVRRRGCVRLQLQIGVGNEAARAFYSRRGFAARAGYTLLDKPLA